MSLLLENIDLSKEYTYTLIQTKKSKEVINIISTAFNRKISMSMENPNTLTFDVPYYVVDNLTHTQVVNPDYTSIKNENMVLLKVGDIQNPDFEYYFIIKKVNESTDKKTKTVECKSREIALNKILFTTTGIERELWNGNDGILDLVALSCSWSIGHVDESALIDNINGGTVPRVRWTDATSKPILQFIQEDIQKPYNVVVFYDTVNKVLNVYDKDNYGVNTGVILSTDNYVKDFGKTIDTNNICTALYVSGRDGADITSVTLDGSSIVYNYNYYINNGQMSSALVSALNTYNALLEVKNVEFQNLYNQKVDLQSQLDTANTELTALQEKLKADLRIQQGYITSGDNTNLPTATVTVNQDNADIASKISQISSLQSQIDDINVQISQIAIDINKNTAVDSDENLIFNNDLLDELEDFTQIENLQTDAYSEPNMLKKYGEDTLKDYSIPPMEFTMDLLDIFAIPEFQPWKGKMKLGDFVRGYSDSLSVNMNFRIITMDYGIDENNLQMTFSNKFKTLDDIRNTWGDTLQKSANTTQYVNTKKLEWNQINGLNNAVYTYMNNRLDVAKQEIRALEGRNKISITENGMFVYDTEDENRAIGILSGLIVITTDGFQTVKTALDAEGLVADTIVGRLLLGEEMYIQNADGTVYVGGTAIEIKDKNGNLKVKLGLLDNGNYGLSIYNSKGQVILDSTGIQYPLSSEREDNLDSSHTLDFYVKIPSNLIELRSAKLSFIIMKYRAYNTTTASSGILTSDDGGIINQTSGSNIVNGDGTISIIMGTAMNAFEQDTTTEFDNGDSTHYHRYTVDAPFVLPDHAHKVVVDSHHHTLQSHNHSLQFNIYESTPAKNVKVYVDGQLVADNGGSGYNSDTYDIELKNYLGTSGYHKISLSTSQNGRLHANIEGLAFVNS